jgi:hypothetical protein
MKDIYIVFYIDHGVEKIDSIWDDPVEVKNYLNDLRSDDKRIVRSYIMNENPEKQNYSDSHDEDFNLYKPWEGESWKKIGESFAFLHENDTNPFLKWFDEGKIVAHLLLEKALKRDYEQRIQNEIL